MISPPSPNLIFSTLWVVAVMVCNGWGHGNPSYCPSYNQIDILVINWSEPFAHHNYFHSIMLDHPCCWFRFAVSCALLVVTVIVGESGVVIAIVNPTLRPRFAIGSITIS